MSGLPDGWAETPLENLFDFVVGGDWGKDPDYEDNDFKEVLCIRGSEFKNWKYAKGKTASLRKVKSSSLITRKLLRDDILIEISGGGPDQPVGRTVLVDEDVLSHKSEIDKVCTNFLRLTRPNKLISSKYLNFYLQHFYYSGEVTKYQGGSNNLRNLKFKEYVTIPVPIPPLNEQIRIANKLDRLLAKVDAAQTRLERIPTLLKRFRQAVLQAATSGELSREWREKIAVDEWKELKIKEVGKVQLGRQRSPKYHTGKNMKPYLRVQNVFEDKIDISDVMEMEFSDEDFERYRLYPGDILLNEGQSPKFLGRPAIFKNELKDACFTNTLIRFQAGKLTSPEFALIVFRNHMHSGRYVKEGTITTNIAHLGASRFSNVEFPLPPLEEQKEIVRRVDALFTLADTVEKQYTTAKQRLDRLSQSLLAKAFRGELVPQDPNDEPASELLKRIQAGREGNGAVKKGRKKFRESNVKYQGRF